MSDGFPSFDDVIDYRRRRLVAALAALASEGAVDARAEATRLILEYLGDDLIRVAFEQAAGGGGT